MNTPKLLPSQTYLRERFDYDPEAGTLSWRERPLEHFKRRRSWLAWNGKYAGQRIKNSSNKRYVYVRLGVTDESKFPVHRIIWKIMTGEDIPEVDHENNDRYDLRWSNLRRATRGQNCQNALRRKDNTSGYKGVSQKKNGKFQAYIDVNKKRTYVGRNFLTAELAYEARCKVGREFHSEFWNPG